MSGRSLSLTSLACHMTCITDWQDSSFTSRRPGWLRLRHLFYSRRQIIYFCYTLHDDSKGHCDSDSIFQQRGAEFLHVMLPKGARLQCRRMLIYRSNMVQDFAVENIELRGFFRKCVCVCVRLSRLLCDVTKEKSVWKAVNRGPKQNLKI